MSVATQPGQTALTRIPSPRSSPASVRVNALSAALETWYAGVPPPIVASEPAPLETFTMRPWPELRSCGNPGERNHDRRHGDVVNGDELGEVPRRVEPEPVPERERRNEDERAEEPQREYAGAQPRALALHLRQPQPRMQ